MYQKTPTYQQFQATKQQKTICKVADIGKIFKLGKINYAMLKLLQKLNIPWTSSSKAARQ
jgi:hypothetical protein